MDQGMRYRSGEFPCTRCGHRSDMHEAFDDVRRCRVCDYIAYRFPCSTATLRDEQILNSLKFDLDDEAPST